MTPWRLFLDDAHNGAHNMAVDEAMLLAHAHGFALPTLRFYGWDPHCLSLGRLQKQLPPSITAVRIAAEYASSKALDEAAQSSEGAIQAGAGTSAETDSDFDIVRRPTGGRAVWHAQEITYCAIVRAELLPPEARSVEGAYNWLSAGFLRGLHLLGLPVSMAPGGVRTNGTNCFAASAGCDFVANGKKLIGAAQCRKDAAILQHGSLLLAINAQEWRRAGDSENVATINVMDGATSLAALGADLGRETVIKALCEGFAFQAKAAWQAGGLNERELGIAELLREQKYSVPEWTFGAKLAAEGQIELDASVEKQLR